MTEDRSKGEDSRSNADDEGDEMTLRRRLAGLTAFQRDLLWVLSHDGPMESVLIKHALAAYYRTNINESRIPPNLNALEERGLIVHRRRDDGTDEYVLTKRGQEELARRRAWQAVGNESNPP